LLGVSFRRADSFDNTRIITRVLQNGIQPTSAAAGCEVNLLTIPWLARRTEKVFQLHIGSFYFIQNTNISVQSMKALEK
jgi:hypothetical protein